MSNNSKYSLTFAPEASPGSCRTCGKAAIPMIDMAYSEEFYGAVYLCFECVEEISGLFGFMSADKGEQLQIEVNALRARNAELAQTLSQYNELEKALADANYKRNASYFGRTGSLFDVADSRVSTLLNETNGTAAEFKPGNTVQAGTAADGFTQQSDDKNVGSVRAVNAARKARDTPNL